MAAVEPQDTPMSEANASMDATDAVAELVLSDDEQRVLALYDRLRAVQLEVALLKAREAYDGVSAAPDIESAQKALLEARAAYVLRNEAVDSVLTVNPILKAVHQAVHASPIERDLLPAVEKRDAASQTVSRQAAELRAVRDTRRDIAIETRRLEKQNVALAGQVRELVAAATEGSRAATTAEAADEKTAAALAKLEADVKASRQRWKLIKGAASAVVVGSGVDWARDEALRDLVLDPE